MTIHEGMLQALSTFSIPKIIRLEPQQWLQLSRLLQFSTVQVANTSGITTLLKKQWLLINHVRDLTGESVMLQDLTHMNVKPLKSRT